MHQLVVHQPGRSPEPVGLAEHYVTIGRAVDNVLVLEDSTVQPHHALVIREGARYRLCSLCAEHLAVVNGRAVTEHVLGTGDVIRLGSVELRLEEVAAERPAEMPQVSQRIWTGRGPWIGVTVLASAVSATVTFLLMSRVPDRAAQVAGPVTAEARPVAVPMGVPFPLQHGQEWEADQQGRFICQKLPGWSWERREAGEMTEWGWVRGSDELRLRVGPAGGRDLDPERLAGKLREFGAVRAARWRQWAGRPAVEVELERVEEPTQWVRVVKMRADKWDHVAAIYAGDERSREETLQVFERWLASYRVGARYGE